MLKRLRQILLSAPAITAAGLLALYLAGGFLMLPAVVKWQIEKQVPEQLGQKISVGAVRFNPLVFRLGVDDLALSDAEGRPLVAFRRLLVDFELRSVIDRAWVFADATLEAPVLRVELTGEGEHNFTPILERLRTTEAPEAGSLPRLIVKRVTITEGRVDFSDQRLTPPLVAHIEPLQLELEDLSTLPAAAARFRLSARTAAGESLVLAGELGLDPVAAKGTLALQDIVVATVVRGLSRLAALDSPAGSIGLAAGFDVAVDPDGRLAGIVEGVDLDVAKLSVAAPGAATPLLALETLSLAQGHVDFGSQEVTVAKLLLAKGRVAAASDSEGAIDWVKILVVPATRPPATAAAQTPPAASGGGPRAGAPAGAARPWRVAVASVNLSEIGIAFSDGASGLRANVAALGIDVAPTAEIGPAGVRMELGQPRLSIAGARLENGADILDLPDTRIEARRVALDDAGLRLEVTLDAPRGTLANVQVAQAADGFDLRAASFAGETLSLVQTDGEIRVVAAAPAVSLAGLAAHRGDERFAIDELSIAGKAATLARAGEARLDLALDALRTSARALKLNRGDDGIEIATATLGGDAVAMAQADGRVRLTGNGARATLAGVAARQGSDRVALQDASLDAREVLVATGAGSSGPSAVEARLAGAALRLASVGLVAQDAMAEILRLASASVGADALALDLAEGPLALTGEGLTAALSDVVINSPADAVEMARLGSVTLAGGTFDLLQRVVTAEKIAVADGKAQTWIDAQGKFNGLVLIRGVATAVAAPDVPVATAGAPEPGAPWRLALKSAELDRSSVAFEDRRALPALAVGLEAMRARIADLDTASATPTQVEIQATVAGGGEIRTRGTVRLDNVTTDLQVTLADVALSPVQRYLSEIAELRLASGTVSAEGRLRYGDESGAGARLAYGGSLAVDRLLLEEVEPKRPFLAWNSIATGDVTLTLEPNRVDIGELRVDAPSARLIIAEDQTVNLTDVRKKPLEAEREPAPAQRGEPVEDPFPVSIARVRVAGGELDFADLSLRPQFRARMHDLKGVITGLGTDADASAKLQLDALVDRYGSARIRGGINVSDPERMTDIDMAFRNLEMTSLSPYVVKFAGYRIAAGRLALDLKYQVSKGKLLGKNKIVLNQVELGEKVDSPGALDLPLDLAIAILKDSDGVIDIGLPVSGDLSDPKFDYGEVIGTAIGNVLGRIVTAPFAALGAMFGAGERKLDTIDFEPGSDTIAPPERQKLETVARALKDRPTLRLVVPPTFAPAEDTAVLKSLAVRTNIVKRTGVELSPGEDPGPIDTANPRVQRAIEAVFGQHYAPGVLGEMKRRAVDAVAPAGEPAAPAAAPARPPAGEAPAATAAVQPATPPPAFYQDLLDRLIAEAHITEPMLAQLADRRGEAIVRELTTVGGVPVSRVVLGERHQAAATDATVVALRLELEVAR